MREGQFIKRNKDRWRQYEDPADDPDELARQFTSLVDDLSYAKTFYPYGNTVKYLNSLGANIYLSIYRNKKEKNNRIITFWTREIPAIIAEHWKKLVFSLLFFLLFVAIGYFSSAHDQSFIRSVLGDSYVDMTEQNIQNGDAFNVYKSENSWKMFFYIATNNIAVAFRCFLVGITCSAGSVYMLFTNGLMVGSFEQMFVRHGRGAESFLTIMIHGTLEISALVLSGGAGLILGNSILFPGTFTRLQSLIKGVKDGLKVMISLVPVFLTAAIFESFVTRHTEMHWALKVLILAASAIWVVCYYVILPMIEAKRPSNTPPSFAPYQDALRK